MMEAQMEDEVAEELKMAEVLCGLDWGLSCRSILFHVLCLYCGAYSVMVPFLLC